MNRIGKEMQDKKTLRRRNLLLDGLITGILVGLVITAYRLGITWISGWVRWLLTQAAISPEKVLLYIGVMIAMGAAVGLCIKNAPLISGSGIPQVSAQLSGRLEARWTNVLPFKFIGGILTLGGGLTLGREGPSVQLGAAMGQAFGEIARRPPEERLFLISCGGAAGLASAFNAPVAGLVFALEELHRNFSPAVLVSASAAAFAGAFVSAGVFGSAPVLPVTGGISLPLQYYWIIILLGVVTGLSGVLFNRCILWGKALYAKLNARWRPAWLWCCIVPFFLSAACCLAFPVLFGSGEPMIFFAAGGNNPPVWQITVFYAMKLALLTLCFGSGLPGGIFFPLLVLGSLMGNAVGSALAEAGVMEAQYVVELALMAMAGHFSAIVRSPVTAILLVSEMTGSFAFMLPLGVVAMVSYGVAEFLHSTPIYESLQGLLPLTTPGENKSAA
ncbi:MAG: ClC family H(+)/Cl(-) exchange transporter [Fretibacterium sp.]|nr:ClC family H(+)/Cl(-) exchange transporter [Fretibacterium sp.]